MLLRAPRHVLQGRNRGGLVVGLPVVEGERQALVLDRPRRVDLPAEPGELALELAGSWMQLEPVVADVAEALDADEGRSLGTGSAAETGDEQIAAGEPAHLVTRLVGDPGELLGEARSAPACRRRRRRAPSAGARRPAARAGPRHPSS